MSKESFEEFLERYEDWQMYVGVNGLNHKAFAEESWNHQQKKIDELEANIVILTKKCYDHENAVTKLEKQNAELREALEYALSQKEQEYGMESVYDIHVFRQRKVFSILEETLAKHSEKGEE